MRGVVQRRITMDELPSPRPYLSKFLMEKPAAPHDPRKKGSCTALAAYNAL